MKPKVRRAQNGLDNGNSSVIGVGSAGSRSRGNAISGLVRRLAQVWGMTPGVRNKRATQRGLTLKVQYVEARVLLSANIVDHSTAEVVHQHASSSPTGNGYTPSQILTAYGFSSVSFSNGPNGTGQTIAIVDAYNDPTIANDLAAFDKALGLSNPPSLTVMSQTGSTTNLPPTDPGAKNDDWEIEESLDVEWAHALAPGANIVLVEANSANESDLMAAVKTAANLPGVSVVSMSWGGSEFSSESAYDSYFTTPAGHQGVTFVASTGDNAAPSGYPAYSPNVLAVGGTTLTLNSSGQYVSESGWSNSGGGISAYESQPGYQSGIVKQTSTRRAAPDVAFDANPNTGVPVYDSFSFGTNGWIQVGGTSFSAPAWAAIVAIADQGRVLQGEGTLNGATQTLPMLYSLDKTNPSAFHDITSGNNGYSAGTGYDLVTGLGSPVVNQVVSGLIGTTQTSTTKLAIQQVPTSGTAGTALGTIKIAVENQSGTILTSDNSTVTLSISSGPGSFAAGSTVTAQVVNGIATFSNVTLNTAGNYTLQATDGSDTPVTSGTLAIAAGQASKVAFQQVPGSGSVGSALGTISVAVEDQFGNIVTSNNSTVTLSVASGPGSLAGSTSVAAVNGVATFTNVSLSAAGAYTLRASDGALTSSTSGNISVTGTGGGGGGGTTLSAPQAAVTAVNSTTAQLSWTPVSGASGYRIYQIISGQSVLLGTVSASTSSVQIVNLVAGSTASFKVEAYNSTSVADSSVVSVTLPRAQTLSAPVVQGTVLSATSAQLTWGAVAGAQGYRVYYWNGSQAVLLNTFSSSTTGVRITGLVPGGTYQFLVEAFNGSSVGDSNWVTITTPANRLTRTLFTQASAQIQLHG